MASIKHDSKIKYDLTGYLKLLVYGRILDPASKLATVRENYDYYTPMVPRPRKHLNPEWTTLTEGSDQENLLQCILLMRRLEFLHEGMRWFDIKRYGIKIYRRRIITALNAMELTDSMGYRDPRQAIQIPFEVSSAGMQPNPRNENSSMPEYARWNNKMTQLNFNKR